MDTATCRAKEIIKELQQEGFSDRDILDAMNDGNYLKKQDITQTVAEEINHILLKKTGGNIVI